MFFYTRRTSAGGEGGAKAIECCPRIRSSAGCVLRIDDDDGEGLLISDDELSCMRPDLPAA